MLHLVPTISLEHWNNYCYLTYEEMGASEKLCNFPNVAQLGNRKPGLNLGSTWFYRAVPAKEAVN